MANEPMTPQQLALELEVRYYRKCRDDLVSIFCFRCPVRNLSHCHMQPCSKLVADTFSKWARTKWKVRCLTCPALGTASCHDDKDWCDKAAEIELKKMLEESMA